MTKNDMNSFAYFPVSDDLLAMGFFLTGAGKQSVNDKEARHRPSHPSIYAFTWDYGRVLPEFQLVYLHNGAGEFKSNETGRVDINPGTAMILMPDVWHSYRPRTGAWWGGYWLSFNGEFPHIWQRSGAISPATTVRTVSNPQAVAQQFDEIIQLALRTRTAATPAASFRALALIAAILGDTAPTAAGVSSVWGPAQDDALVQNAMDLIWNNSHGNLSVATIAQRLHTSRRTLERRFSAVRGHGVLEELTDCRLNRAQRMLRETHIPIKRIAYMTGFTSSTHLFRVFRRKLGIAPGDYRKIGTPPIPFRENRRAE